MIALATPLFDLDGTILHHGAIIERTGVGRRTNRIATIDGSSAFQDRGYSVTDQTLNINFPNISFELEQDLLRIISFYNELYLACELGFFLVQIDGYSKSSSAGGLRIMIKEQLNGA